MPAKTLHIAYPNMDQVRTHCAAIRQCPNDGSITEIFTCNHCQKEYHVKIKGPGGIQLITNQLPLNLHLLEKHNIQAASLQPENRDDFLKEMKSEIDKNKGDMSKIAIKTIKNFCLAFGAKERCYEEYLRVMKEKFGDAVGQAFAAAFDTPNFQGSYNNDFMAKGAIVRLAEQRSKQEVANASLKLVAKQFKIAQKDMYYTTGEGSVSVNGKQGLQPVQVPFVDPITQATGLVQVRAINIWSRKVSDRKKSLIFTFQWPFQSLEEDFLSHQQQQQHQAPKLLQLLQPPEFFGGTSPAGYVSAVKMKKRKEKPETTKSDKQRKQIKTTGAKKAVKKTPLKGKDNNTKRKAVAGKKKAK